jgi:rSAM/selenodomain-associated transferase 1
MNQAKRLGIFAKTPVPGEVKTRLTPPLSAEDACRLYEAFLTDLFRRLARIKSTRVTVFHAGSSLDALTSLVPEKWGLVPQKGGDLGQRLVSAFDSLLQEGGRAVIIGSDSPDLPIQYIRRAFQRLKHKDVVLGPATDGGYYLVGLRALAPAVFQGVSWGTETALAETVDNVRNAGLSLHVLPMWYDVDTEPSLRLLETMMAARRIEGRDRLTAIEAVLERIR